MDTLATDIWKTSLERILASFEGRDTGKLITQICNLAADMGHDAGEALLEAHPEFYAYKTRLTSAFDQAVLAREDSDAAQLMRQEFDGAVSYIDLVDEIAADTYKRLSGIFDRVDFSGCSRVVMVGCGRRPFTMFHIHDKTAVRDIIGLDTRPEAVEGANALAAKLGYDRMHAVLCDGCDYDFDGAQIVYIASMVAQKAAVVSRIADTAADDVEIVVREPCSLGLLWSESAERSLDSRMEVTGYGPVSRTLSRDIFLTRQGGSTARGSGR
jgi:hypothetical protein